MSIEDLDSKLAAQGDAQPVREQEAAMAAAAGASGPQLTTPHSTWTRQGRMAMQSSHTLSAPMARLAPERLGHESAHALVGAPAESEPPISIPESVMHVRPPQKLPGDTECRSPIAGLVTAVMAQVGQQVDRNQPVLVIEAMKMQNHVGPQVGGTLRVIHVCPGQKVKAGQLLFELA